MINDQLSDFLTRLRNAGMARLTRVDTFNNRLNRSVADILVREGYLKSYREITKEGHPHLRVYLRYEGGDLKKPVIQGLKRVSRPGLRRYHSSQEIPKVMSGYGLAIVSTSKGVLSDKDARAKGVGGEYICSVW